QISSVNSRFVGILGAAQIALSMQRADDFLMLPGRPDYHAVRAAIQKNSMARKFLAMLASIDPQASNAAEQMGKAAQELPDVVNSLNSNDSDSTQNPSLKPVTEIVDLAGIFHHRPLIFLLLDDKAAADRAATQLRNSAQQKTVEQVTALAL